MTIHKLLIVNTVVMLTSGECPIPHTENVCSIQKTRRKSNHKYSTV